MASQTHLLAPTQATATSACHITLVAAPAAAIVDV